MFRHKSLSLLLTIIVLVSSFFLAISACTTLEIGVEQTATPNLQLTEFTGSLATQNVILATRIAIPTQTPSEPDARPSSLTPSPTLPDPLFTNLRFSAEPDENMARQFYVEGIARVFAIWDFSGMREGMVVRRAWTRDNEEWIVREEPWPYYRYGSAGTVRDIYVFEEESGLSQGEYSLTLSIDGVVQSLQEEPDVPISSTFWIFAPEITTPLASPDKSHTAYVRSGSVLVIEYPNGEFRELDQVQEIAAVAWFPDGINLLYVERDRTNQVEPESDSGITHRLFIINIDSLEKNIIGTVGENFHSPIISPSGEYISVLSGSQSREACNGSPGLAIIELDQELRRQAVFPLSAFSGVEFPDDNPSTIILSSTSQTRQWQNATQLLVELQWICKPASGNPDGLYLLDIPSKSAESKD